MLEQIAEPLLQWFDENKRILPWRQDPTPYHVWISEIMLQQTRVEAVKSYYARFTEALPGVAVMQIYRFFGTTVYVHVCGPYSDNIITVVHYISSPQNVSFFLQIRNMYRNGTSCYSEHSRQLALFYCRLFFNNL